MVDEPGAGAYYGSIVAAPYGRELFEKLFDYLGEEKLMQDAVCQYVEMPSVEGLSVSAAAVVLKNVGIEYELDGEGLFVAKQLPPAGTNVKCGQKVLLIC